MANSLEIAQIVNVLQIAYPKHFAALDDAKILQTQELYMRMLSDIDAPILKAAAEQHIAESQWFPTVAELRNRVYSLTTIAKETMSAEEAWGIVIAMAGARGRDSDSAARKAYLQYRGCSEAAALLIMRSLDAVGWRNICNCDEEGIGVIRAHFYRTYTTLEQREATAEKMLPQVKQIVTALADKWRVPMLNGARSKNEVSE